ncbi:MAG: protein phosphatase CheZ [Gammaproteobacteria bacterium]|nr:protein phosphatase CheZ [Gammaproteobacteria bacterium]
MNIEMARELVTCLERGDRNGADEIISEISRIKNSELFQQIGKLTRDLHDVLKGFEIDSNRLSDIAVTGIPDAKERLNYVMKMTSDAATKTLESIEEAMPVCESNIADTKAMHDEWIRFVSREMTAAEFRTLSKKISAFLGSAKESNDKIKDKLNEILMAQGFQDLTGQILTRVIKLVQDVEDSLIKIIKISKSEELVPYAEKSAMELEGPQIAGKESASAVKSQDEVDDLLSSLGF